MKRIPKFYKDWEPTAEGRVRPSWEWEYLFPGSKEDKPTKQPRKLTMAESYLKRRKEVRKKLLQLESEVESESEE